MMNISDGIVVDLEWVAGYVDGNGQGVYLKKEELFATAVLVGFFHLPGETENKDDLIVAFVMLPNGRILRTATRRDWHTPKQLNVKSLTAVGLVPHFDMDEFVEACFEAGYTKLEIGNQAICSYDKNKKAPEINGWPAIWRIAEKFGIYGGCGGNHTAQLCRFKPTGKYQFGEILPPESSK